MKIVLITLVGLLLGLYLLACWVFRVSHPSLLFHPESLPVDFAFDFPHSHQEVVVREDSSGRLHGLLFTQPKPIGVVLYLHGNGGNVSQWGHLAPDFLSRGYDFLVYDYRGYGKSSGTNDEAILLADATAAYHFLWERYSTLPVVVYGRSIGTGPAAYLAATQPVAALALETPYFSIPQLAGHYAPYLPYRWLLKYKLPTGEWAAAARCPVWVIHGTADEIIPYKNSEALVSLQPNLHLVSVPGGRHNDLSGYPQYEVFLDSLLGAKR